MTLCVRNLGRAGKGWAALIGDLASTMVWTSTGASHLGAPWVKCPRGSLWWLHGALLLPGGSPGVRSLIPQEVPLPHGISVEQDSPQEVQLPSKRASERNRAGGATFRDLTRERTWCIFQYLR